jgi:hypothetical protein
MNFFSRLKARWSSPPATAREPRRDNSDFVAQKSGFVFPEKVAEFTRGPIKTYEKHGSDVSIAYFTPSQITVSVYVYSRGPATEESRQRELEKSTSGVLQLGPGAEIAGSETYPLVRGESTVNGTLVTFDFPSGFPGHDEAAKSILLLFSIGDFYLKFRCTYQARDHETAWPRLKEFVERLKWPEESKTTTMV